MILQHRPEFYKHGLPLHRILLKPTFTNLSSAATNQRQSELLIN